MTPEEMKEESDWQEAWKYAGKAGNPITRDVRDFEINDVVEVIATHVAEGDYAETTVDGIFRMKDGVYVYLNAGCDTTGWDCQAGGSAEWHEDLPTLMTCLDNEKRDLLLNADTIEALARGKGLPNAKAYGAAVHLGARVDRVLGLIVEGKPPPKS